MRLALAPSVETLGYFQFSLRETANKWSAVWEPEGREMANLQAPPPKRRSFRAPVAGSARQYGSRLKD